jgi:2-polyprenyl-3-methyl-5-hydroxy-6-metoxy-1,4-benzoquinol methylase
MNTQSRFPNYMEDQRTFFDQLITEDWADYASPEWDFVRQYEIKALFRRIRPATILDIGCGCGFHDREMAMCGFVRQVDAIDYSSASIAKANEHYPHEKVTRWVADIKEMPTSTKYDLVVSFQVFEHVSDPEKFLRRCGDLCRSGGHVAVFTPNRRRLSNIRRWARFERALLLDPQHFKEYVAAEIVAMAQKCDLTGAYRFGYGMHGISWIDRMPVEKRIRLGEVVPFAAHGMCVVLRKH